MAAVESPRGRRLGPATAVAAGILLSRLFGFLRVRVVGAALGLGPHADVLGAALRAPNVLQVLLGEGTLSASIIPVYARLLEEGRRDDARRFAGALFGLLTAVTAALVLLGMVLAEPLVAVLASGFLRDAATPGAVDRFALTVRAVRIIFPMTGCLVLSVWALAILNSHRRFFLAYAAPAAWNLAIIAALLSAGRNGPADLDRILFAACWGALAGGALQFLVQLPAVLSLLGGLRPSFSRRVWGVKEALAAFWPLLLGRGVVQLGGYFDLFLASFLATGAVAALGSSQYLYLLPVSLFGMSVAAAELPELARRQAGGEQEAFVARVRSGALQVGFLVTPTVIGYLGLGWLIVALLFQTGRFGPEETWLVYLVLAAYSLGLPASTTSRLLQNAFYALADTKLPARVAAQRVLLAAAVGAPLMLALDRVPLAAWVGGEGDLHLGAVGLAAGSAVGAWYERLRLGRALAARSPAFGLPGRELVRMATAGLAALALAAPAWWLLRGAPLVVTAGVTLPLYAGVYLGLARLLGVSRLGAWLRGAKK
ncbi:MAG TPA: murein biosynthesis integral membrane protein MurJ [Thermoanaerobaculia bacterium]|nr:murein biosynthesis integral membrane protein MurJ [Thermoanaerobaculia bacterium]